MSKPWLIKCWPPDLKENLFQLTEWLIIVSCEVVVHLWVPEVYAVHYILKEYLIYAAITPPPVDIDTRLNVAANLLSAVPINPNQNSSSFVILIHPYISKAQQPMRKLQHSVSQSLTQSVTDFCVCRTGPLWSSQKHKVGWATCILTVTVHHPAPVGAFRFEVD